ncbi:MAG: SDR family oxidoreductase [Polyangiales bacterium]
MKVLITGISGTLGRLTAQKLIRRGHEVVGIDRRPWPGAPDEVELVQADIRKRPAEDVFRTQRPDAAIHMATVTHLVQQSPDRMRVNLYGTRAFIHHCQSYGVKQAVFVGRHTFYGAAADSPLYHTEDEPPMSAHSFPELADLVAADLYAASSLWRYPEIATAVLRVVYTLGPSKNGTLATFLRGPNVPLVMGFDPLFQFIHEDDAAEAVASSLEHKLHGIYNVAGPSPVPLSTIVRAAGRRPLPVPSAVFKLGLGRMGLPYLPAGAIDHLKYPIVVDGDPFRRATEFTYQYDERETINSFRTAK